MKLKDWAKPRGRKTELSAALTLPPQLVGQWAKGQRPVPASRRPAIEAATRGEVICEDMGGDVLWGRVPDPAWPWHPQGRPLLDVVRTSQPAVITAVTKKPVGRTAGALRKAGRPAAVARSTT